MKKLCRDCELLKAPTEFYKTDTSCKVCRLKKVRQYRAKNIEKVRAYDRQRGQLAHRQAANRRRYRERISTPEGRKREWEKKRQYINSDKRAANIITGNAIRNGRLIKQPCERCGSEERIEAHHEDYTKPLDVVWLCKSCHGARHREINEANRG